MTILVWYEQPSSDFSISRARRFFEREYAHLWCETDLSADQATSSRLGRRHERRPEHHALFEIKECPCRNASDIIAKQLKFR